MNLFQKFLSVFKAFNKEQVDYVLIGGFAVIRYGSPEGFHIDIMAKVGGIVDFNTIESRIIQVENVPIRVATPESLFIMKKDSIRPEDQRDIEFLKEYIKGKK